MFAEVAAQIFVRFYITKRNNGSSGLGIHIAYNTVPHPLYWGIETLIQTRGYTMSEISAYEVICNEQRYEVITPTGVSVMVCSDEPSAKHYANILSRAYQAGYKQAQVDNREKNRLG